MRKDGIVTYLHLSLFFCLFLFMLIFLSQPKASLWFLLQWLLVCDDKIETLVFILNLQSLQQRWFNTGAVSKVSVWSSGPVASLLLLPGGKPPS